MRKYNKKVIMLAAFMFLLACTFAFKDNVIETFNSLKAQIAESTLHTEDQTMYVFTVKYMYVNGTLASTRDVYSYTDGEELDISIPEIDGYTRSIDRIRYNVDENFINNIKNNPNVVIEHDDVYDIYKIYYTVTYQPDTSKYKIVHYMQNIDDDGYTPAYTEEFTDNVFIGDYVSAPSVNYEGFTFDPAISTVTGYVNKEGTTELALYYNRNSYYIYISNSGDTYCDPIAKRYGSVIGGIPEVTKEGHRFDSWTWSYEQDGEAITAPVTMPAEDLFISANWIPEVTSYTIAFYTENPNDDDYRNVGTYEVTGITSGTNVKDSITTELIQREFQNIYPTTYQYYTYNEEYTLQESGNFDSLLIGNRTTIINVYFDRNRYNITFNLNDSATTYTTKAIMVVDGQSYSTATGQYTFNAKYEQDIYTVWPTAANFEETGARWPRGRSGWTTNTYYMTGWSGTQTTSFYTSSRLTLTSDLIADATAGSTTTYKANWSTNNTRETLYYLVESFDQTSGVSADGITRLRYNDKYYDVMSEFTNVVYNNSTNWGAKDIQGLTNVGIQSDTGNYIFRFFYDRQKFTFTFYNVNATENYQTELLYGQSVEDISKYVPEGGYPLDVPDKAAYVFNGWYIDSTTKIPIEWTKEDGTYKTVIDNYTLYSGYTAPMYDVKFNTNEGQWNDKRTIYQLDIRDKMYHTEVESADNVRKPVDPTKKGYTFVGWYYQNDDGEWVKYLFDASQKVYKDIELVAYWEANNTGTYTAHYVLAQFDEAGNVLTDISQYKEPIEYLRDSKVVENIFYGTQIVEYAETITDDEKWYLSNEYEQELVVTVNDEDNVLYFFYVPQPSVPYTVYYVEDTGYRYKNGEIPPESVQLAESKVNELKDIDDVVAHESSIDIDGYEADAYEKSLVATGKRVVVQPTDNAIYFYYSPVENYGQYKINYFFMDDNGNYPDSPDYVANGEASVGKYIYAKDYYKYLDPNTEPGLGLYEGHEFDKDKSDILMVAVSFGEVSTINLYFKNLIYEVTYDTMGGTFTDTRDDIYAQIEDELYLELVQYKHQANEPSEPTKDGFRFAGWYDKKTNEKYSFDTPVTENTDLYAKWIEVIEVSVTKVWEDNFNQDGKRPDEITVNFMNGNTVVDTETLDKNHNWYDTYTLDKYEEGTTNEIDYKLQEVSIPDYETEIVKEEGTYNWTITNKHTPETAEFKVIKGWNDNNDQDGKRPESVDLTLTADGEAVETITVYEKDGWQGTFTKVDIYIDGKPIVYDITEKASEYYTTESVSYDSNTKTYTVVNKHIPETKNRTVTKIWRDGSNEENSRADSVAFILLKNGVQYGSEITLTSANEASNSDEWEYTFYDLPVYENGEEIKWTVRETNIPNGYGVIYNQDKLYIYNCYPPEVEISVEKIWDDEDNADGIRPSSVTVQLYADGQPYKIGDENVGLVVLSEENNWKYTWPFVEKYNEQVEEYNYEIGEVNFADDGEPEKYTSKIQLKEGENDNFQRTYQIINSYVPQKTSKTVNKVWDDENNRDGIRPESVTVHLLANGEDIDEVLLNKDNNWTYKFENINVNKLGVPISYSLYEEEVDGYTTTISYEERSDIGNYTITNSHELITKNLTLVKEWDDNNNQDGKRAAAVYVDVLADGTKLASVTLTEGDNWKETLPNVYKYRAGSEGEEIVYTLKETAVPEYDTTYEYNGDTLKAINKHIPEQRTITLEKVWNDDNNRDNNRPDSITVALMANGEVIEKYKNIVLDKEHNWQVQIDDLDKYFEQEVITYRVNENLKVGEYDVAYNYEELETNNKISIVNSYEPQRKIIQILKVWEDESNKYEKRPEKVDVDILANGEIIRTEEIENQDSDTWNIAITGLFVNENGEKIEYSIQEHSDEHYDSVITNEDDIYTITNTLKMHNITTKVEGAYPDCGKIVGDEEVAHGNNSTKDKIVITPNIGYKISKIVVRGEDGSETELDLPTDPTVEYIVPQIENVTENKEVVVEFERKEYNITARVESGNGTILKDNDNPYETEKVLHGDDSQSDIKLSPDYGWEIGKITVVKKDEYGVEHTEELPLPANVREDHLLDKFQDVVGDIEVIVEYVKTEAKVVVKHVAKNGNELGENEIQGYIGDPYETHEEHFDNYYLVDTEGTLSGTMDDVLTEVKYIYEFRPDIHLTKIVKGTLANLNKEFEFTIEITDTNGQKYDTDVKYSIHNDKNEIVSEGEIIKGEGNFTLKHKQTIDVIAIPEGYTYSITELGAQDYTTYINDDIALDKNTTDIIKDNTNIEVVNKKEYIAPTGIILSVLPFGIGMIIAIIVLRVMKKKKIN